MMVNKAEIIYFLDSQMVRRNHPTRIGTRFLSSYYFTPVVENHAVPKLDALVQLAHAEAH